MYFGLLSCWGAIDEEDPYAEDKDEELTLKYDGIRGGRA